MSKHHDDRDDDDVYIDPAGQPSYSVEDFCKAENISASTYYKLKKLGLAPREQRFPGFNTVRIFFSDRFEWQQRVRQLMASEAAATLIDADFTARSAVCTDKGNKSVAKRNKKRGRRP